MSIDRHLNQIAADQGGIILGSQAVEAGISRSALARRVKNGSLVRVKRDVYRAFDLSDVRSRLRAAVATLPDAVVSHESAAEIHNISSVETGLAVVTVHTRTTHDFLSVKVHRGHDLATEHLDRAGDLPVTTIPRTVVDLAGVLHPRQIEWIVDDLLAAKRLNLDSLIAVAGQVVRRGKPGSQVLHRLLGERTDDPLPFGSRLERLGLGLLLEAGLPIPEAEFAIPWNSTRRFDLAYPREHVAIEWDSRRWHSQLNAFERDRMRDRSSLLHGWRVFRFTWQDVTDHPSDVVGTIRLALKQTQGS